ncbi:CotS family spore coat protein [Tumebacillus lipolyticus]|uniref:CotS family spore coat protein n=1 Tax=Tumebacillus lipolyticus TaxID=1280370 RepID=A0ABW4ZUQ4_9BACL
MAKEKELTDELRDFAPGVDLEDAYGLKILNANQVRAVVKIETDRGTFALKKVGHKPEKLQFICEAQEHLWNNGFQKLPRFVKTGDGRPFIEVEDGLIFLSNWIEGKESNVNDLVQLKQIVRLQAELHRASRGFQPSVEAHIKTRWAGWIERFEEELADIADTYKRFRGQQPQSELEEVFLATVEPMLEMAETGVRELKASPYREVLRRERNLRGFVHGDFTYHNFIQTPDDEMMVIDFDYCAHELRAHDFARFMRKMLRRTDWSVDTGNLILRTYHEVDHLYEDELQVLRAVLFFPQRYWRAVERGFLSLRYTPEGSIKKMRQEVARLDNWKRFLDSFPTRL